MLSKIRLLVNLLIIGWWGVSLFFLFERSRTKDLKNLPDLNLVYTGNLISEEWLSIYLKGDKVGYTSRFVQDVGKNLLVIETSYLRLPIGGIQEELTLETTSLFDSSFALKSVSSVISGSDASFGVNALISEKNIKLTISKGTNIDTLVIPYEGRIYSPAVIPLIISADKFRKKEYFFPTFDPITVSKTEFSVRVLGKTSLRDLKAKGEIWVLELNYAGFKTRMYVSESGQVIMEEGPGGMVSYADDKKGALQFTLDKKGTKDLLLDFSIFPKESAPIARPRSLVYLKVYLSGFEKKFFDLNATYQVLIEPETLIISTIPISGELPPDSCFLKPTPFVQSDDIRIISKAKAIASGIQDTIEILQKINDYLYRNIVKAYRGTLPSAVEVLNSMKGDCNEHSILFVALARALGIPSRTEVGLIYKEGRFFYHSWVSAFAKGRWWYFDPTLGQTPPDATHIRLVSGELNQQIALLRLENPTIKIISFFSDLDTLNVSPRYAEWLNTKGEIWKRYGLTR